MKLLQKLKARFIKWHNDYFGEKSFVAACEKAEKINQQTGKKMFVMMVHRDYEAVSKKEFKKLWHKTPSMKHRIIQEWEKYFYELKPTG